MGQRVQLKDENNNNVYPVIGKRCAICNNNSNATWGWYKVATIEIGGAYTDRYIKLRVTSTYGDQGSGILCIHTRGKGDGTVDFTKIMWESKTTGGIYPNNYRVNAIYGTDKSVNLYVSFGARYSALRFELISIEDRSLSGMVSDDSVILYSYNGVLGGSLPSTGTTVKSWYLYQIGAVYLTYGSEDPANIFGGTWEKQKGGYLYGCMEGPGNSTGNGTSTGGPSTNTSGSTTLTIDQIPNHSHKLKMRNAGKWSWNSGSASGDMMEGGYHWDANNTTFNWLIDTEFIGRRKRSYTYIIKSYSRNILLSNVGLEANCLIH